MSDLFCDLRRMWVMMGPLDNVPRRTVERRIDCGSFSGTFSPPDDDDLHTIYNITCVVTKCSGRGYFWSRFKRWSWSDQAHQTCVPTWEVSLSGVSDPGYPVFRFSPYSRTFFVHSLLNPRAHLIRSWSALNVINKGAHRMSIITPFALLNISKTVFRTIRASHASTAPKLTKCVLIEQMPHLWWKHVNFSDRVNISPSWRWVSPSSLSRFENMDVSLTYVFHGR